MKKTLCAGGGEGQDKAFGNFVLPIKVHWKKGKMEQLSTENAVSSKENEMCLLAAAAKCGAANRRSCNRTQTLQIKQE